MHEIEFADAALPAPVTLLGLLLRPYALGHELVLLRQRSPFLCLNWEEFNAQPIPQQIAAVAFAIQICAVRPPRWNRYWRWQNRHADWPLIIAEFRNYLLAGRAMLPLISSSEESDREAYEIANGETMITGGRGLGSPLLANLINFCLGELRLTYADALESPFGLTASLYFAKLEAAGQVYVENHREATARREMTENRAEVKRLNQEARAQWAACTTPEEQAAAYAKNSRLGTVFAVDWYEATTDAARHAAFEKWGIVAKTELERAGIALPQPATHNS